MEKVLDFGCGKGYFTNYLSNNYEAKGVDINKNIIIEAKNLFSRPKYILLKSKKLPFKESFFDKVYCYDVLEHVDDLKSVLNEIKRVLKKDGILEIIIPYWKSEKFLSNIRSSYFKDIGHVRVFKKNELQKILYKKSFEIKKVSKEQFIKNMELYLILKKEPLKSQFGDTEQEKSLLWRTFFHLFSKNLFRTPLKYFFFIWMFTLPFSLLMDNIFQKSVKIIAVKK